VEKKDAKIPFSIYDFFGYLACGFILLVAVDYGFDVGWVAKGELGIVLSMFWIIVAYITGHIVAHVSGEVIERRIVRRILRSPEETLFEEAAAGRLRQCLPGFFEPLPKETRDRVLLKVRDKLGVELMGRALFLYCHPIVKREPATLERLNTFLNMYGFCRNMSMALLMTVPVLLLGAWLRNYLT